MVKPDITEPGQSPRAANFSDLSSDEREQLRWLNADYDDNKRTYRKEMESLGKIRVKIQESVDPKHFVYTRGDTAHEVLSKLNARFKPTDYAKKQELRNTWLSLQKSTKVTETEDWLQMWETIYDECKEANLPEVQDEWPANSLIEALRVISPSFANSLSLEQAKGQLPEFKQLVQLYRNWYRNTEATRSQPIKSSVFTTELQQTPTPTQPPQPTLQNRDSKGKKRACLCGGEHKWSKCAHLFEWNRQKDWKPDEAIQQQIKEKCAQNPYITKVLQTIRDKQNKPKPEQPSNSQDNVPMGCVATGPESHHVTMSAIQSDQQQFALHDSFILDSGATDHVCNNRARFTDFRLAKPHEFMILGNSIVQIEGWGIVTITLDCETKPTGKRMMQLLKTAYIPTFTTNIASFKRFYDQQIFWDTENQCLKYQGQLVGRTTQRHGQWCLEYNPITDLTAFSARKPQANVVWSHKQAHERMGHLYAEAVNHLPSAWSDLEKIEGKPDPNCQICKEFNAKQQISRHTPARATTPFYRLCWDVIPMKDNQLVHLYDDYLGFHFVWRVYSTQATDLVKSIQQTVNLIKTRWGYKVVIIRLDGQTSLLTSNEWSNFLEQTGITAEVSAPYVHAQNGAAERSGGVLTVRAAKLKAEGNLPEALWSDIYEAAAYILNRSPTRRLNWETPIGQLELMKGNPKPKGTHIRRFGCRAYALKYNRNQLDRLESRAHIGYLIGYESTNIFKVWIPQLSRVIRARDVTFDETKVYQPDDKLADNLIEQIKLQSVPRIEVEEEEDDLFTSQDLPDNNITTTTHQNQQLADYETTIDQPGDTIIVDESGTSEPTAQLHAEEIRTPEPTTQDSTTLQLLSPPGTGRENRSQNRGARHTEERSAHMASLENLHYHSAYHSAFATATMHKQPRIHHTEVPPPPANWTELLAHPHRAGFEAAAQIEYNELWKRGTFTSENESDAQEAVIPTQWVFTWKFDEEGYLVKYKARLVVRGDLQPRKDEETYAATLAARLFRLLMAITAYFDLEAYQFDAVNAFLNAPLKEKIWIKYPPGFRVPQKVLLVHRALYGLRISPLLWYELLCTTMKKLGLRPVPECACLFTNSQLIVFFYVDDIVVLFHKSNKGLYEEFRTNLMGEFKLREIGQLKWFLGIRVLRDRIHHKLWLCQDSYITKIAKTFNLQYRKARTPMSTNLLMPYKDQSTKHDTHRYQRKVGSIAYLASTTRPDCSRALQKLSEFLQNPSPDHEAAADQCIAYAYTTRFYALEYSSSDIQPIFQVASDASFADDNERRWSTEGGIFKLFGGCIDWFCTLQRTVTTSSTEAELLALSHICAWLFWWRRVFEQLELDLDSESTVHCDNLQTVRLMMKDTPKLVTKLKHIDIHQHWLRQEVAKGEVKIEWISTAEMPADGLTKALSSQKHSAFIKQLNLIDISTIIEAS
jgi:hypothetical protein